MKEINWNVFEMKFNNKQESAFERLAYSLFCSRFDLSNGVFAYKNQIGIETEPILFKNDWTGFQAKYLSPATRLPSYKKKIIESLEKAKDKNPKLSVIYFFINKPFSESSKSGKKTPQYLQEIESKAKDLKIKIEWQVPSHIEKQLSNPKNISIANEFFPEFVEKEFKHTDINNKLEVTRTALIQLEIAKIKFGFKYDWTTCEELFDQFYLFVDFRNEIIAKEILTFLSYTVSSGARFQMPGSIACSIEGLVLTFFPSSYGEEDLVTRIENGNECIQIGYNLVYDALIHTSNFEVAQWGLAIWKFIYRESKRSEMLDLVDAVLDQYKDLERTLDRPGRDLGDARELVSAFKADLDTYDLSFPPLPEHLYKLIDMSK